MLTKIRKQKMQTIKELAAKYSDHFEARNRTDGTAFVVLKDDAPEELQKAVRDAHGDKLPNDWVFSTFWDLLDRISEYDSETVDDLRDHGHDHEIVDGYVDIYTHDLLQWLASDIDNIEYLADASDGWTRDDGVWQLLARAQYYAIEAVMQRVLGLLETSSNEND